MRVLRDRPGRPQHQVQEGQTFLLLSLREEQEEGGARAIRGQTVDRYGSGQEAG